MQTPDIHDRRSAARHISHRDVDEILKRQRLKLRRTCNPDYRLLLIAIALAVAGLWLLWCFHSPDAVALGRAIFGPGT